MQTQNSSSDARCYIYVNTEAAASYSEVEYTRWMKTAGFTEVSRVNLPGPDDLIVGLVK